MALIVSIALTGACLLSFLSLVTSAPVLEEEELAQILNRVYSPEFSGLQIVVGRGSKVPIENAAAWALATDCSEDFSNRHLLQNTFDRIYKTNFEDRCAEVLPVFINYKQRIDEIVRGTGMHREDTLKKMALSCRELIRQAKKREVYNIFVSYTDQANLVNIHDTCCDTSRGGSKRSVCFAGKFEVEFDENEAREAREDNQSLFSSISQGGYSTIDGYVPANQGIKKKKE